MNFSKHMSIQLNRFNRLPTALLVASCFLAGCSGSSENTSSAGDLPLEANTSVDAQSLSDTPALEVSNDDSDVVNDGLVEVPSTTNTTNDSASNDVPVSTPTESPVVNTPTANPSVPDPLIQNRTTVSFDITVPAYQSNELSVAVLWGDVSLAAAWVGDEYWSTTAELPTETAHPLSVTFYDANGSIKLASYSEEFRTGSSSAESFQVTASQFDASQFDEDGDGNSNLAELMAGTDPLIDEDALLEIEDYYSLGFLYSSRMNVSNSLEARVTEERPYFDSLQRDPVPDGYPGIYSRVIDIDADGNGTILESEYIQSRVLELDVVRINTGNAITWEGNRYQYDGDYGHRVSFTNTVTVVDEVTRSYVEELVGSNGGTYNFNWEASANLTGHLVEGTSLCEFVSGTISQTYRSDYHSSEGTTTSVLTVSKELDDLYWRVERRSSNLDGAEFREYFVRKIVVDRPNNSDSADRRYFACDFVDH